ncbi:PAS domain S-box protein [uncultured Thiodictyon sp.]|jgi:diguanylate cyclase (GGDEF)-like protein/PAS domain S-box-containing protein|uniref:PAS domain S-box protein n=1 Tax=uncultured Thiodictyon sp. TaxID=1846217 RepID=UPI0025D72D4A|nr:PAS domain S-box protein [uncultured Thiodictyon sp.]
MSVLLGRPRGSVPAIVAWGVALLCLLAPAGARCDAPRPLPTGSASGIPPAEVGHYALADRGFASDRALADKLPDALGCEPSPFPLKWPAWLGGGLGVMLVLFGSWVWTRRRGRERLRVSETRFRAFFEKTSSVMLLIDPAGGAIIAANQAAVRYYGYPPQDLVGMPISAINTLPPDAVALERQRALREERNYFNFRHRNATGEVRDVEVFSTPVDVSGKPLLFSVIHDITDRKQQEIALREANARLALAQRAAHAGVWDWDIVSGKLSWSDEFFHLLDLDPATTPASFDTWRSALHPADLAAAEARIGDAIRAHVPLINEYRIILGAGESRWIYVRGDTTYDAQGQPLRMIGICIDISARKQMEEALRDSEERFRTLAALAPVGIYLASPAGNCLYANQRWCEMAGMTPTQALGDGWLSALHPADRASVAAHWQGTVESGERWEQEYRLQTPGGVITWVHGLATPQRDVTGTILKYIGVNLDITERRQASDVQAFLARTSGRSREETFFHALARYLAETLDMFYVCIDRLEGDGLTARTLAVWCDGHFEDDLSYALKDTPCGDVVGKQVCCFAAGVCQSFPRDQVLQDLRAESYIGTTLWSHDGRPIGLIAVIGREPLRNRPFAESALELVALRSAGELERLLAEESLHASEEKFRTLAESLPQIVWMTRADGWYIYFNQQWVDYTGLTLDESYGHGWNLPFHPDDQQRSWEAWQHAVQTDGEYSLECRLRRADGVYRWWLIRGASLHAANGQVINWFGTCTDIQDLKESQARLRLAAGVFTHASEGIMITAADGTIIDVNDAFSHITGYRRDEVLGRNPRLLSDPCQGPACYADLWRHLIAHGQWRGELWNRRKNGEVYAVMETISAVPDAQGQPQQFVALFSDITPIKEHERALERVAHYDALTGLPNRVLLADRLQHAMAQAQRHAHPVAVVLLDLDGFKVINDLHGHDAGDQFLIAAAARMRQTLRESDTFARLGGDEFVAVLPDLADTQAGVPMITRLLVAAAQPVQLGDLVLQVSASLGVTFYPQADDIDAEQLLRQADQAMYQAKLAGKGRYHFFDAEYDRRLRGHHEGLERIHQALMAHEFVLYYQPKVNLRSGTASGAEALIRWQHPQRGLLPPGVFLPLIEDHPLAVDLGEWVIDTALTQIERWQTGGLALPLSVNVGARQLQQADFLERLRAILAAHPAVAPGYLELEVLETSALDLVGAARVIDACRALGVTFALDDFGTGYSSLTYLRRLRVARIKIDQSFVRGMLDDADDLAIVEGVLGLAAAFRRQVIAEGVETVAQGTRLLQLGCELAQGYGIAHPMPAADLPGWSAAWRPDPAWVEVATPSRNAVPWTGSGPSP